MSTAGLGRELWPPDYNSRNADAAGSVSPESPATLSHWSGAAARGFLVLVVTLCRRRRSRVERLRGPRGLDLWFGAVPGGLSGAASRWALEGAGGAAGGAWRTSELEEAMAAGPLAGRPRDLGTSSQILLPS